MHINTKRHFQARFRLRTIFFIVTLTVLLLPLAGIIFLRIYENELVRQTEAELIAQAAFLSAVYQNTLIDEKINQHVYGVTVTPIVKLDKSTTLDPILPTLDLNRVKVLPQRPDGLIPTDLPDPIAIAAGLEVLKIIVDAQKTTLAGMKVLDYQGIVVSGRFEVGRSFAHLPEIQQALKGNYYSVLRERISDSPPPKIASISRGTGIRVFIAYPIMRENRLWGVVHLSRTPKNVLVHLYAEKEKVFLFSIFILGLAVFIGLFTANMVSRPIARLIEKIKHVSQGDRSSITPLKSPGSLEVQMLSESFMKMASILFDRMDYLKEFAMHISHEFKTPVTSIQGSAELLQDHLDEMDASERKKFLANIISDAQRLQHLVKRLLDLARADNILPGNESIELHQLLKKLQAIYLEKNLEIIVENIDSSSVAMSEDNLTIILQNLFDNAMQHGATRANISAKKDENKLKLIVSDNGKGISKANKEKVFTPFFTTKRNENGTGLGLVIIKSLLEKHGGSIQVADKMPEAGATFILFIPVVC